jgi:hypothetical protein
VGLLHNRDSYRGAQGGGAPRNPLDGAGGDGMPGHGPRGPRSAQGCAAAGLMFGTPAQRPHVPPPGGTGKGGSMGAPGGPRARVSGPASPRPGAHADAFRARRDAGAKGRKIGSAPSLNLLLHLVSHEHPEGLPARATTPWGRAPSAPVRRSGGSVAIRSAMPL